VITDKEAVLWTDLHHLIQAEKELDPTCWKVMCDPMKDAVAIINWIAEVNQI
jgi:hypothetical protein